MQAQDHEAKLRERLALLNELLRAEQESRKPSERYIEDLHTSIASIEEELKPKVRRGKR